MKFSHKEICSMHAQLKIQMKKRKILNNQPALSLTILLLKLIRQITPASVLLNSERTESGFFFDLNSELEDAHRVAARE
jgi:hypothetical protein